MLRLVVPDIASKLKEKVTKRVILSSTQSIFDPLGFISFNTVLIRPKLLLQQAWISRVKWNEELDENIQKDFKEWLHNLSLLNEIHIARWAFLSPDPRADITLHVFNDASKRAYAAVIYVRMEYDSQITISLFTAKARVAPVLPVTIPRLELLAASMATRLAHSALCSLRMNEAIIIF